MPGQYFDPETGLYHNGFRDHAPGLTRYVESDPIGLAGGMNSYGYVHGNPIKWTDAAGLDDSTTDTIKEQATNAVLNKFAAKLGCDADSWCRGALGAYYAVSENIIQQTESRGKQCINYSQAAYAGAKDAFILMLDKVNPEASLTISTGPETAINIWNSTGAPNYSPEVINKAFPAITGPITPDSNDYDQRARNAPQLPAYVPEQ